MSWIASRPGGGAGPSSVPPDLDEITDEELLKNLWQQEEDFSNRRRIRARMYKLREKRLREMMQNDEESLGALTMTDDGDASHQTERRTSETQKTRRKSSLEVKLTYKEDSSSDSSSRVGQQSMRGVGSRRDEDIIEDRIKEVSKGRGARYQQVLSKYDDKNEERSSASRSIYSVQSNALTGDSYQSMKHKEVRDSISPIRGAFDRRIVGEESETTFTSDEEVALKSENESVTSRNTSRDDRSSVKSSSSKKVTERKISKELILGNSRKADKASPTSTSPTRKTPVDSSPKTTVRKPIGTQKEILITSRAKTERKAALNTGRSQTGKQKTDVVSRMEKSFKNEYKNLNKYLNENVDPDDEIINEEEEEAEDEHGNTVKMIIQTRKKKDGTQIISRRLARAMKIVEKESDIDEILVGNPDHEVLERNVEEKEEEDGSKIKIITETRRRPDGIEYTTKNVLRTSKIFDYDHPEDIAYSEHDELLSSEESAETDEQGITIRTITETRRKKDGVEYTTKKVYKTSKVDATITPSEDDEILDRNETDEKQSDGTIVKIVIEKRRTKDGQEYTHRQIYRSRKLTLSGIEVTKGMPSMGNDDEVINRKEKEEMDKNEGIIKVVTETRRRKDGSTYSFEYVLRSFKGTESDIENMSIDVASNSSNINVSNDDQIIKEDVKEEIQKDGSIVKTIIERRRAKDGTEYLRHRIMKIPKLPEPELVVGSLDDEVIEEDIKEKVLEDGTKCKAITERRRSSTTGVHYTLRRMSKVFHHQSHLTQADEIIDENVTEEEAGNGIMVKTVIRRYERPDGSVYTTHDIQKAYKNPVSVNVNEYEKDELIDRSYDERESIGGYIIKTIVETRCRNDGTHYTIERMEKVSKLGDDVQVSFKGNSISTGSPGDTVVSYEEHEEPADDSTVIKTILEVRRRKDGTEYTNKITIKSTQVLVPEHETSYVIIKADSKDGEEECAFFPSLEDEIVYVRKKKDVDEKGNPITIVIETRKSKKTGEKYNLTKKVHTTDVVMTDQGEKVLSRRTKKEDTHKFNVSDKRDDGLRNKISSVKKDAPKTSPTIRSSTVTKKTASEDTSRLTSSRTSTPRRTPKIGNESEPVSINSKQSIKRTPSGDSKPQDKFNRKPILSDSKSRDTARKVNSPIVKEKLSPSNSLPYSKSKEVNKSPSKKPERSSDSSPEHRSDSSGKENIQKDTKRTYDYKPKRPVERVSSSPARGRSPLRSGTSTPREGTPVRQCCRRSPEQTPPKQKYASPATRKKPTDDGTKLNGDIKKYPRKIDSEKLSKFDKPSTKETPRKIQPSKSPEKVYSPRSKPVDKTENKLTPPGDLLFNKEPIISLPQTPLTEEMKAYPATSSPYIEDVSAEPNLPYHTVHRPSLVREPSEYNPEIQTDLLEDYSKSKITTKISEKKSDSVTISSSEDESRRKESPFKRYSSIDKKQTSDEISKVTEEKKSTAKVEKTRNYAPDSVLSQIIPDQPKESTKYSKENKLDSSKEEVNTKNSFSARLSMFEKSKQETKDKPSVCKAPEKLVPVEEPLVVSKYIHPLGSDSEDEKTSKKSVTEDVNLTSTRLVMSAIGSSSETTRRKSSDYSKRIESEETDLVTPLREREISPFSKDSSPRPRSKEGSPAPFIKEDSPGRFVTGRPIDQGPNSTKIKRLERSNSNKKMIYEDLEIDSSNLPTYLKDIEYITDTTVLEKLLEKAESYEERRVIRGHIRTLKKVDTNVSRSSPAPYKRFIESTPSKSSPTSSPILSRRTATATTTVSTDYRKTDTLSRKPYQRSEQKSPKTSITEDIKPIRKLSNKDQTPQKKRSSYDSDSSRRSSVEDLKTKSSSVYQRKSSSEEVKSLSATKKSVSATHRKNSAEISSSRKSQEGAGKYETSRNRKSSDDTRKSSRDKTSRKSSRDDTVRRTSRDDTTIKGGREEISRKTSRDNVTRNFSRENATRQTSRDDTSRKTSRDDTSRKSSRDDTVRKSSRDDTILKTSREDSYRKSSPEGSDRYRNYSPENTTRYRRKSPDDKPKGRRYSPEKGEDISVARKSSNTKTSLKSSAEVTVERKSSTEYSTSVTTSSRLDTTQESKEHPKKYTRKVSVEKVVPEKSISSRETTRSIFSKETNTKPESKSSFLTRKQTETAKITTTSSLRTKDSGDNQLFMEPLRHQRTVTKSSNVEKSDVAKIVSPYGVGPTDEYGLPLIGLKALRRKNQQQAPEKIEQPKPQTPVEEFVPSDSQGRPLFGIRALKKAPETTTFTTTQIAKESTAVQESLQNASLTTESSHFQSSVASQPVTHTTEVVSATNQPSSGALEESCPTYGSSDDSVSLKTSERKQRRTRRKDLHSIAGQSLASSEEEGESEYPKARRINTNRLHRREPNSELSSESEAICDVSLTGETSPSLVKSIDMSLRRKSSKTESDENEKPVCLRDIIKLHESKVVAVETAETKESPSFTKPKKKLRDSFEPTTEQTTDARPHRTWDLESDLSTRSQVMGNIIAKHETLTQQESTKTEKKLNGILKKTSAASAHATRVTSSDSEGYETSDRTDLRSPSRDRSLSPSKETEETDTKVVERKTSYTEIKLSKPTTTGGDESKPLRKIKGKIPAEETTTVTKRTTKTDKQTDRLSQTKFEAKTISTMTTTTRRTSSSERSSKLNVKSSVPLEGKPKREKSPTYKNEDLFKVDDRKGRITHEMDKKGTSSLVKEQQSGLASKRKNTENKSTEKREIHLRKESTEVVKQTSVIQERRESDVPKAKRKSIDKDSLDGHSSSSESSDSSSESSDSSKHKRSKKSKHKKEPRKSKKDLKTSEVENKFTSIRKKFSQGDVHKKKDEPTKVKTSPDRSPNRDYIVERKDLSVRESSFVRDCNRHAGHSRRDDDSSPRVLKLAQKFSPERKTSSDEASSGVTKQKSKSDRRDKSPSFTLKRERSIQEVKSNSERKSFSDEASQSTLKRTKTSRKDSRDTSPKVKSENVLHSPTRVSQIRDKKYSPERKSSSDEATIKVIKRSQAVDSHKKTRKFDAKVKEITQIVKSEPKIQSVKNSPQKKITTNEVTTITTKRPTSRKLFDDKRDKSPTLKESKPKIIKKSPFKKSSPERRVPDNESLSDKNKPVVKPKVISSIKTPIRKPTTEAPKSTERIRKPVEILSPDHKQTKPGKKRDSGVLTLESPDKLREKDFKDKPKTAHKASVEKSKPKTTVSPDVAEKRKKNREDTDDKIKSEKNVKKVSRSSLVENNVQKVNVGSKGKESLEKPGIWDKPEKRTEDNVKKVIKDKSKESIPKDVCKISREADEKSDSVTVKEEDVMKSEKDLKLEHILSMATAMSSDTKKELLKISSAQKAKKELNTEESTKAIEGSLYIDSVSDERKANKETEMIQKKGISEREDKIHVESLSVTTEKAIKQRTIILEEDRFKDDYKQKTLEKNVERRDVEEVRQYNTSKSDHDTKKRKQSRESSITKTSDVRDDKKDAKLIEVDYADQTRIKDHTLAEDTKIEKSKTASREYSKSQKDKNKSDTSVISVKEIRETLIQGESMIKDQEDKTLGDEPKTSKIIKSNKDKMDLVNVDVVVTVQSQLDKSFVDQKCVIEDSKLITSDKKQDDVMVIKAVRQEKQVTREIENDLKDKIKESRYDQDTKETIEKHSGKNNQGKKTKRKSKESIDYSSSTTSITTDDEKISKRSKAKKQKDLKKASQELREIKQQEDEVSRETKDIQDKKISLETKEIKKRVDKVSHDLKTQQAERKVSQETKEIALEERKVSQNTIVVKQTQAAIEITQKEITEGFQEAKEQKFQDRKLSKEIKDIKQKDDKDSLEIKDIKQREIKNNSKDTESEKKLETEKLIQETKEIELDIRRISKITKDIKYQDEEKVSNASKDSKQKDLKKVSVGAKSDISSTTKRELKSDKEVLEGKSEVKGDVFCTVDGRIIESKQKDKVSQDFKEIEQKIDRKVSKEVKEIKQKDDRRPSQGSLDIKRKESQKVEESREIKQIKDKEISKEAKIFQQKEIKVSQEIQIKDVKSKDEKFSQVSKDITQKEVKKVSQGSKSDLSITSDKEIKKEKSLLVDRKSQEKSDIKVGDVFCTVDGRIIENKTKGKLVSTINPDAEFIRKKSTPTKDKSEDKKKERPQKETAITKVPKNSPASRYSKSPEPEEISRRLRKLSKQRKSSMENISDSQERKVSNARTYSLQSLSAASTTSSVPGYMRPKGESKFYKRQTPERDAQDVEDLLLNSYQYTRCTKRVVKPPVKYDYAYVINTNEGAAGGKETYSIYFGPRDSAPPNRNNIETTKLDDVYYKSAREESITSSRRTSIETTESMQKIAQVEDHVSSSEVDLDDKIEIKEVYSTSVDKDDNKYLDDKIEIKEVYSTSVDKDDNKYLDIKLEYENKIKALDLKHGSQRDETQSSFKKAQESKTYQDSSLKTFKESDTYSDIRQQYQDAVKSISEDRKSSYSGESNVKSNMDIDSSYIKYKELVSQDYKNYGIDKTQSLDDTYAITDMRSLKKNIVPETKISEDSSFVEDITNLDSLNIKSITKMADQDQLLSSEYKDSETSYEKKIEASKVSQSIETSKQKDLCTSIKIHDSDKSNVIANVKFMPDYDYNKVYSSKIDKSSKEPISDSRQTSSVSEHYLGTKSSLHETDNSDSYVTFDGRIISRSKPDATDNKKADDLTIGNADLTSSSQRENTIHKQIEKSSSATVALDSSTSSAFTSTRDSKYMSAESTREQGRSFLDDRSKVSGISDVLSRMGASEAVDHEAKITSDDQARSLLNKFLGAQVLMTGVESMMANTSSSQASSHSSMTRDSGGNVTLTRNLAGEQVTKSLRDGDMAENRKTFTTGPQTISYNVSSSASPKVEETDIVKGVNINEVTDDFALNQLLDSCEEYDERRRVRMRLKALMAEKKVLQKQLSGGHERGDLYSSSRKTAGVSGSKGSDLRTSEGTSFNFNRGSTSQQVTSQKSSFSSSYSTENSSRSYQTDGKNVSAFDKFKQLDSPTINKNQSVKGPIVTGPLFQLSTSLSRSASGVKDMILTWCQCRTRDYQGVKIENFSTSWNDGMAFCALIHHFYPDAFDFKALDPKNRRQNFSLAFRVADEKAGVMPLLDVEDMVMMKKPDWKCVFTYVQSLYKRLKDE